MIRGRQILTAGPSTYSWGFSQAVDYAWQVVTA